MVRISDKEMKLMHELIQDALIDEVRKTQGFEEVVDTNSITTQNVREDILEKLEIKLRP